MAGQRKMLCTCRFRLGQRLTPLPDRIGTTKSAETNLAPAVQVGNTSDFVERSEIERYQISAVDLISRHSLQFNRMTGLRDLTDFRCTNSNDGSFCMFALDKQSSQSLP